MARTLTIMWILAAIIFSISVTNSQLTETEIDGLCEDPQVSSCTDCIRQHPKCVWCLAGRNNVNVKRCRSKEKFDETGECEDGMLENPNSTVVPIKDDEFSVAGQIGGSGVTQLKPQKIHLQLRKGETKKFNVTFRKISDYPVDLYYVMDLSNSMTDDLQMLKKLGETLAKDIQSNVTNDIQLGFGTFVDKVMMPFASTVPAQLRNPCFKNRDNGTCAPPFGFKHQQSISGDLKAFEKAVDSTEISGNIDSPEGGFDALMQIAVCTEQIGWREEATHLVVFTTDASFHMALDGKLAAILETNDLGCHLERGANPYLEDDLVYSRSKEQDYPSIGQLRHVFNTYKIQPIFAVTEGVKTLYDGLRQLIPNSHVDQLAVDSSNIIGIIKDAYSKLKGKLEMTWVGKPDAVDMKYRVLCPSEHAWKDDSLKCDNISIGSEVVYEFEITATDCPKTDPTTAMSFTSSSLQESVEITFGFECDCQCTKPERIVPNSPSCSTNGSLVCGICECDSPHEGAQCQCTREKEDESLVEKCKRNGGEICEGNGQCECGSCLCDEGFSESFCQCSNKGCPKDEGGLCGGVSHGTCQNCDSNGKCVCDSPWYLDTVYGTCSCNLELCKANTTDSQECSGNGKCNCKRCECNNDPKTLWSGQFCEICVHPDCKEAESTCEAAGMQSCARCVNEAQRNRENTLEICREKCKDIKYQSLNKIPKCDACVGDDTCVRICSEIDNSIAKPRECVLAITDSECDIQFEVVWSKKDNDYLLLVKEFNKEKDCRKGIDPIMIVLPIIAGIVLLGLLALAAWKIYQTVRDKKEWQNFEKEMKQSRWTKGQNPIFQKPFTKFQNPTYQGK